VAGPSGQGKSHLVKALVAQLPRVLVVDTLSEYELPYFTSTDSAASWFARVRPERFRIALRVSSDDVDRALRWAWDVRPCVVVLEETDLYAPPGDVCEGLKYIAEYGRRFHLGLVAVTRRPFAIDRRLTANARFVVLFPTKEPRDRLYWQQFIPQELVVRAFEHLDRSTQPGEYALIDVLQRTCELVSRRGPSASAEPDEPEVTEEPEPEPEES
jgi:hypothetical protein